VEAISAELVGQIVVAVPRASWWHRLAASRVPAADEGASGRCPQCGRSLPRFSVSSSVGAGTMVLLRTRQELVHECLADGPRAGDARRIEPEEFPEAARAIADALRSAGWSAWAATLTLPQPEPGPPQVEHLGQALEVLRRFGPLPNTGEAAEALNALVASSGRYWGPASSDAT
jgi:hypothetical protein